MKGKGFTRLFEEARKSPDFWVAGAILEFTEELIACMEERGVSRAELARRIGRSPAYVTKILRGTTNFTLDTMVRLTLALGTTVRVHVAPVAPESTWEELPPRTSGAAREWRSDVTWIPTRKGTGDETVAPAA